MSDQVHMMISIPPKYAVSQMVGFIKGKSAIHLARVYGGQWRNDGAQSSCQAALGRRGIGLSEDVLRAAP
jgi:putative transposase